MNSVWVVCVTGFSIVLFTRRVLAEAFVERVSKKYHIPPALFVVQKLPVRDWVGETLVFKGIV